LRGFFQDLSQSNGWTERRENEDSYLSGWG
jgi:hypothetical protein